MPHYGLIFLFVRCIEPSQLVGERVKVIQVYLPRGAFHFAKQKATSDRERERKCKAERRKRREKREEKVPGKADARREIVGH